MKNSIKLFLITISMIVAVASCKEKVDEPPMVNEEELITTVELSFRSYSDTNDVRVFQFADPDGLGGNEPTIHDTIRLDTNSSYALTIRFLDESGSNVKDITEEVKEEANDHLICYSSSGSLDIQVIDLDDNSLPLGLESSAITTDAEVTDLSISLKHQPGIKTGDCQLGETDVEVLFQVEIE